MSENKTLVGADQSDASTIAAVATAASDGGDGYKLAMDRMNVILGDDRIKGDAKRMSTAVDLANASPEMKADAVVGFVAANVPASVANADTRKDEPAPSSAAYEQQRMTAAGLAMPGGQARCQHRPKNQP